MKLRNISLIILLLSLATVLQAQLKKGDKYFGKMDYPRAIEAYQIALDKQESTHCIFRIAESYRLMKQEGEAEPWYYKVVFSGKAEAIHYLHYAKSLKANDKFDEAKEWFTKYGEESGDTLTADQMIASCDRAQNLSSEQKGYDIDPVPFNTRMDELMPVPFARGIAFMTERPRGFVVKTVNSRSNRPFYDLFYAEGNMRDGYAKPTIIQQHFNTRVHDGPVTFSPAEHEAFITRSNLKGKKIKRSKVGVNKLKVYKLKLVANRWKVEYELPYNSNEYSVAHPSLSPDETTLFFSSDMPGGFGGKDIYVAKLVNGVWGSPKNLGAEVNSPEDEVFPYIRKDSTLYFSSRGHNGLGGLDIYSSRAQAGNWTQVRNMGYPLNSTADDFGLFFLKDEPKGFFTSDRKGGKGGDDIYAFKRYPQIIGRVLNQMDGKPVANAEVEVMDINGAKFKYTTDKQGNFTHFMTQGKDYFLKANAESYFEEKGKASNRDLKPGEDLYVELSIVRKRTFRILGVVRDLRTELPIPHVQVRIAGAKEDLFFTDAKGYFEREMIVDEEYTVLFSKPEYIPMMAMVSTWGVDEPVEYRVDQMLEKAGFMFIEGEVKNKETGEMMAETNVRIIEAYSGIEVSQIKTDAQGKYFLVIKPAGEFSLVVSKENYFSERIDINSTDTVFTDSIFANFELITFDTNKVVKTIYYDYNKSDIRKVNRKDLNEFIVFLKDNPNVSVELSSHTDSRGSDGYNQPLSEQRANAAVQYIRRMGIKADRIISKGYGKTQLVNKCATGVPCTEAEHQENRRTELKVIKIKPAINKDGGRMEILQK